MSYRLRTSSASRVSPKTNAIIERCNGDVLAMTRSALIGAGLPACFWPYAAPCVCFNDNSVATDDGSPWQVTHKAAFKGLLFFFGCGVRFKPSPTKYTPVKWDGRAMFWGLCRLQSQPWL